MSFSFRAMGMRLAGTVGVTDTAVEVDVAVPLMARPFEPQAKARIMATLDELFA